MKHDLKNILFQDIQHLSSQALLDDLVSKRSEDASVNEDRITDPDVLAMRKEYFAMLGRGGRKNLEKLNQKIAENKAEKKVEKSEEDEETDDEEEKKKRYDKNSMTDLEMSRVRVWIQRENEDEDGNLEDIQGAKEADGKDSSEITELSTSPKAESTESRSQIEQEGLKPYKHHHYVGRWGMLFESDGKDEEWFTPSPPTLPESDPEYLCGMCRHIDFRTLLSVRGLPGNYKKKSPGTTIELYGLGIVLREANCVFCKLLRQSAIAQCPELSNIEEGELDGISILINVLDESPEHALRLEIEFGGPGETIARIVIRRMHDEDTDAGLPLEGRPVVQEAADLMRLKSWLSTCESGHSHTETRPRRVRTGLSTLRVIDTELNCVRVVDMPARYACLSYVWGTVSQVHLTTTTIVLLESPGGLLNPAIALNPTIQDALRVTRETGLRYIWIDALCIIQDDPTDKDAMISRMSSIYGNAALTIVASTNTNPTQGLPGISVARTLSQMVVKVQGMTLSTAFQDERTPCHEIESSTWNSRAWTFQERHLSRRNVYFTSSQMTFTCEHDIAFEDTVPVPSGHRPAPVNEAIRQNPVIGNLHMKIWSDPTQARFPNKAIATEGESTMVMYAADPKDKEKVAPDPAPVYKCRVVPDSQPAGSLRLNGETLWGSYCDAVSSYTQRNLTFQSDVVNAFTGVADLVARDVNTKFWYGMPEFAFDHALLWVPKEPLKRRGSDFPSWSWAGWKGHVEYRGRGWYNAITFPPMSVVQWLLRRDKRWLFQNWMADGERSEEQVEKFLERLSLTDDLILEKPHPFRVLKIYTPKAGWRSVRDEDRSEHLYEHDGYPGLRFSYPVSPPGESLLDRPASDGTLYFRCRAVEVRFCDMKTTPFMKDGVNQAYLQIGTNDQARSANYRPSWKRIIYHQGYRAGFLTLNVPFKDLGVELTAAARPSPDNDKANATPDQENADKAPDQTYSIEAGDQEDAKENSDTVEDAKEDSDTEEDAKEDSDREEPGHLPTPQYTYRLLATSRSTIPSIAPPPPGWDWYWTLEPTEMQYQLYQDEWDDDRPMRVPLPGTENPEAGLTDPDPGPWNENGDPRWDEDRFGSIGVIDVYDVLLVRRKSGVRGDWKGLPQDMGPGQTVDERVWERVGVGKMSYRAFWYAGPKDETVVLR